MVGNFSAYDFITTFVPGAVFAAIVSVGSRSEITSDDIVLGAALYFFYGVVASRIGSLIVQPILEITRFLKAGDYDKFIIAEKADSKIQALLEARNFYRSLLTALLLTIPLIIVDPVRSGKVHTGTLLVLITLSSVVMLFSLRKQSSYIESRVKFHTRKP